jgi:hypothetical protein
VTEFPSADHASEAVAALAGEIADEMYIFYNTASDSPNRSAIIAKIEVHMAALQEAWFALLLQHRQEVFHERIDKLDRGEPPQ